MLASTFAGIKIRTYCAKRAYLRLDFCLKKLVSSQPPQAPSLLKMKKLSKFYPRIRLVAGMKKLEFNTGELL